MFIEVEQQIKQALEKAFKDYPEIKDNIQYAIGKENTLKETPMKMPAIRIVFMGHDVLQEADITGKDFTAKLEYAVLLFFRSFKEKTAESVYEYLQVIQETLKGFQTTKGILKPSRLDLEITSNFYVYVYRFNLETIV